MSHVPKESEKSKVISHEDYEALIKLYDGNHDGKLDRMEIKQIISDYNKGNVHNPRIKEILLEYDTNKDGTIDSSESESLVESFRLQDSNLRYSAYSVGLSRLFRYLAFTSDFGEALRPVVHKRIVNASYAIAFGYCFADVGWEVYKTYDCKMNPNSQYSKGAGGEKYMEMTVAQCLAERSAFQALASLVLPAIVIHQSVHMAKNYFTKMNRFTKWGPSAVGLCIIPLLPLCLDVPIERVVEYGFRNYGPWAVKGHIKIE